jgi:phage terminase large subunit-like protein
MSATAPTRKRARKKAAPEPVTVRTGPIDPRTFYPLPVAPHERTDPLQYFPQVDDVRGDAERMLRVLGNLQVTQGYGAGQLFKDCWTPWQQQFVRAVYGPTDLRTGQRWHREAFLLIGKGNAKGLDCDELLATPRGMVRMGDIAEGDYVMDMDGNPCRVMHCSPVNVGLRCFAVTFDTGETIVCDEQHLWVTQSLAERKRGVPYSTKPIAQLKDTLHIGKLRNHRVPVAKPIAMPGCELPIDPYMLGRWLGDGNSADARVIVDIHEVPSRPTRCIAVDSPTQTYLVGPSHIPTHNTTTASMLAVAHTLAFPEPRGLCVVLADGQRAADLSYDTMASAIEADPYLSKQLQVRRYRSDILAPNGTILRAIPANIAATLGLRCSLVIVDELHALGSKTAGDSMVRQLLSGMAGRANPLAMYLTTAPIENARGIYASLLARSRRKLAGESPEDRLLPLLFEHPGEPLDYDDPATWWHANPSAGYAFDMSALQSIHDRAKESQDAREYGHFLSQHLCVPATDQLGISRWLPLQQWESLADESLTVETLQRECSLIVAGIDAGRRDDPSALVLVGKVRGEQRFLVWSHQWMHTSGAAKHGNKVDFQAFADRGDLTLFDTEDEDRAGIMEVLRELAKYDNGALDPLCMIGGSNMSTTNDEFSYRLGICVDAAGLASFVTDCERAGMTVRSVAQGWKLSPWIDETERLFYAGKLTHSGNSMLAFNISNACTEEHRGGVRSLQKPTGYDLSAQKIDGALALLMGIAGQHEFSEGLEE